MWVRITRLPLQRKEAKAVAYTVEILDIFAGLIFFWGSFLYWPPEAQYHHIQKMKEMSLGVYFNLFSPEFEGTLLFIIGSVLFAMAAFVNGLSLKAFDTGRSRML